MEGPESSRSASFANPEVGKKVVEGVCEKIHSAKIFELIDGSLLERVALVESRYGLDTEGDPDGGIWRVRKDLFDATQLLVTHPTLPTHFRGIEKAFGIHWREVRWREVWLQPLVSALAAGLIMTINCARTVAVGRSVEEQGEFWLRHYYSTERKRFGRNHQLLDYFVSKVTESGGKDGGCLRSGASGVSSERKAESSEIHSGSSGRVSDVKAEGKVQLQGQNRRSAIHPDAEELIPKLLPVESFEVMKNEPDVFFHKFFGQKRE